MCRFCFEHSIFFPLTVFTVHFSLLFLTVFVLLLGIFLSLVLPVLCLDLPCPPTLWSIVALCITLYSSRGCFFFFPCLPLFSDCTPCEADLHALRLTAGFLYNFHTVPVVCSADLKMKWNRKRLILTVGFCFFFPSVFLDATCRGRTGGCSASSWIGITTRCSWRSPAVWSACRWAAAPTTAPARSESPIEQSFFFCHGEGIHS